MKKNKHKKKKKGVTVTVSKKTTKTCTLHAVVRQSVESAHLARWTSVSIPRLGVILGCIRRAPLKRSMGLIIICMNTKAK